MQGQELDLGQNHMKNVTFLYVLCDRKVADKGIVKYILEKKALYRKYIRTHMLLLILFRTILYEG